MRLLRRYLAKLLNLFVFANKQDLSMNSLDLKMLCPDEGDPITDGTFALLRDYLQPDSNIALKAVAKSIEDLLPSNAHGSEEIAVFGETCIEIAEQIPYYHKSHLKLASFLEYFAKSHKVTKRFENEDMKHQYVCLMRLGHSLRDTLNGPDKDRPRDYINFHAFAAHLFERHIWPSSATWAIWAQRDAFEENTASRNSRGIADDVYILAAAQWILWYGQTFFKQLLQSKEVPDDGISMWKPGPLYTGTADLTLDRWHFWKHGYRTIASSGRDPEKGGGQYSNECRDVAGKAAALMDAFEQNMTF